MSNYKIRVNSKAESKEAQQLFFELGYNWFKKGYVEVETPETIMSFENWALSTGIRGSINHKEITLPELRDMVVLKRNSIDDANYECNGKKYFLSSTGNNHCWHKVARKGVPVFEWVQCGTPLIPEFKPIEKPMKEYLMPSEDYKLIKAYRKKGNDWIEIPEGAISYARDSVFGNKRIDFYKDGAVFIDGQWMRCNFDHADGDILWQRHTHPEELPFIDDEPLQSLNDQYAEIEKVRQSHRTASERADPTIKETLNQRQDQYGSFEDVAQTTEQLFQVIKGGASFVDFTESQRMALYMIFSKVARLSNGNPNHKDSWHDIAGYATLIDNELVSEKDMPF